MTTKKIHFLIYGFSGFFFYLNQNASGSVSSLAQQKTRVIPEGLKLSGFLLSLDKTIFFSINCEKHSKEDFPMEQPKQDVQVVQRNQLFQLKLPYDEKNG